MASSSSSSTSGGPIARGSRRRRLVLKLSQKDTLQALFQQNPYPGIATRERLARELGIAESRVQIWFQNRRARHPQQSARGPGNDTPWSSPRAAADEEGVEAILEAPLREEDYQALLDMLPGSPGPRA
ncbi:unnamed protein product [Rangifer tarandus platyrhynchus]|uniref:Uncharacterized protein n=1 Tax=Rangifer tarandus platyrhynchus TaxID=3082113 RepID=A0AC59YMC2_RANTA